MAAETLKFKIEGAKFEVASIDDFNVEEWEIVYDASGLHMGDFVPALDDNGVLDKTAEAERVRRTNQPAFMRARLVIGHQRANPTATEEESSEVVRGLNLLQAVEILADAITAAGWTEDGTDDSPPESTLEPDESSQVVSAAKSGSEPTVSNESSDAQADAPVTTGTNESDTSSPASHPTTSVA